MRRTTLATLDVPALTAAFNLVYTDYLVPLTMDERQMARHVAVNDIVLAHSPLWLDGGGAVVGLAALGARGARGWVGDFGVAPEWRGRGLAAGFAAGTLDAARAAGLRTVQLEVITGKARHPRVRAGRVPRHARPAHPLPARRCPRARGRRRPRQRR